uniref:TetR/AcrR family transcriptional regulator n=1 Tax=Thaumasiovibrio occultus TaxID=1891184 RepID=UPI000B35A345|nr:TetR/AcrR family transcriptional regulator [Thaumasiovibrio occultus]
MNSVLTKSQQTKLRILTAAFNVASELGLDSLTIGELAKQVGMSKSGLFAHFQSRENLQVAVIQYAGDVFMQRVIQPVRATTHPSVTDKIHRLLEHWLVWNPAIQGSCMFLEAWCSAETAASSSVRSVEVQAALDTLTRQWLEYLRRQFVAAVDAGELAQSIDPWQAVYRIYGAYLSSQFLGSLGLETERKERFWQEIERIFADHKPVLAS